MDGQCGSLYSISVTILVSDFRRRDGDGAVTTILDTILDAVGRQLGLDRNSLRKLASSEERRRGM